MAKNKKTGASKNAKAWGGRFSAGTSSQVEAFTESISFDHVLYHQDIRGSMAHARMLKKAGLLNARECVEICRGLKKIEASITAGTFKFSGQLEDIHMHVEAALIKEIGPAGGKLHTARSRNDQVSLDMRMWLMQEIVEIKIQLAKLQHALLSQAEDNHTLIMPGLTHLQHAQPVLAAHHLLAYVEMLERDCGRLEDAHKRTDVCPLGSGALAGTTLPIQRQEIAEELGFSKLSQNSMDAVSDRDFCAEFLFVAALAAVHLSRLAEDLILWASAPLGYVLFSDAHCTGSSMMPQKKNPDTLELARGKTGRMIGNLNALLVTLKGLPMTYNRDLQEDKAPVFDSARNLKASLAVVAETVQGMRFHPEAVLAKLEEGFLDATALADYLVLKKVPFRKAHEIVGGLVALCIKKGCKLADLSLETFIKYESRITKDVFKVLGPVNCIKAYIGPGSSAPVEVSKQLRFWKNRLKRRTENTSSNKNTSKRKS